MSLKQHVREFLSALSFLTQVEKELCLCARFWVAGGEQMETSGTEWKQWLGFRWHTGGSQQQGSLHALIDLGLAGHLELKSCRQSERRSRSS